MLRTLQDNGLAPSLKPLDKEFLELDVLNALYELKQKECRINRDIIIASKIVDKNSHIRESIRLFTEYKEIENTNAYEKFLETIESIKNAYKLVNMDLGGQKDKSKRKHKKSNPTVPSVTNTYKFTELLAASLDSKYGETKSTRSDGQPPYVQDETMFRIEHELTQILDETEKSDQVKSQELMKSNDDDSKKEAEELNATGKSSTENDNKTTTKLNVESAAFVPNNRWVPSSKLNQQPWYENKLLMTAIKDSYKSKNPLGELPSLYERWSSKSNPQPTHWESLLMAVDHAKKASTNAQKSNAEQNQPEHRSRANSWTASQKKAYDNPRPGPSRSNQHGKQKSRNSFNGYDKNRSNSYQQKSNHRPEIDTRVYKNSDRNNLEPTVKSFFSRNSNFTYKSLTTVSTEIVQEKETLSVKAKNTNRRNPSNSGEKEVTTSFAKFINKMKKLKVKHERKQATKPIPINRNTSVNPKRNLTLVESTDDETDSEPKPGTSKNYKHGAIPSNIIFIAGGSSPSPNMEILSKRFNAEQLKGIKNYPRHKTKSDDDDNAEENEFLSPPRRRSSKSRRRKRTPKKSDKGNLSQGSANSLSEPTFEYEVPLSSKEDSKEKLCLFCRYYVKDFRPEKAQHRIYDKFGKVTCPVLFETVCRFCGATGPVAHITSFCPFKEMR